MNNQLEHGYKEFNNREVKSCGPDKWFWRMMAVLAVVLTVLFVTSIQHIWFTQVLINGMAG